MELSSSVKTIEIVRQEDVVQNDVRIISRGGGKFEGVVHMKVISNQKYFNRDEIEDEKAHKCHTNAVYIYI